MASARVLVVGVIFEIDLPAPPSEVVSFKVAIILWQNPSKYDLCFQILMSVRCPTDLFVYIFLHLVTPSEVKW